MKPCFVFCSPGPPMYASRCKLAAGHDGPHDFGTEAEARAAWDGAVKVATKALREGINK